MKIGHEDPQLNAFSFKVKHSENNFVFFQKSRSISWGKKKMRTKKMEQIMPLAAPKWPLWELGQFSA